MLKKEIKKIYQTHVERLNIAGKVIAMGAGLSEKITTQLKQKFRMGTSA